MALAALQTLKHAIELDVPAVDEVHLSLNALADSISGGGPGPRQELIDADGYNIIVSAWKYFCNTGLENARVLTPQSELIREASLNALAQLSFGFPQIADEDGYIMIVQAFYNLTSEPTKIFGLKFMNHICTKNEANREALAFEHHIGDAFVHLIKCDQPSAELVREWCGAARAFTLSDDETVAYNRSAERKRLLYQHQAYRYLVEFLHSYPDEETLNPVIDALILIAQNEDFCVAIEQSNGLRGLQYVLETYPSEILIVQNAITCLRYMYTSPIVREKGGSTPIVKLVLNLANTYRDLDDFLEAALSCLAFITLKNPCGAAQLLIENGVQSILEIMKLYAEVPSVLKHACLILRNVASISGKIGRLTILEAGGEHELRHVGGKYRDLVEHHVNPVLKDLGLQTLTPPSVTGDERVKSVDGALPAAVGAGAHTGQAQHSH